MGRYIDDILQPGEKVLYSTNAHWVFFLPAIAVWIVALVLFLMSRMTLVDSLILLCSCGSAEVDLTAGRELRVLSVELEVESCA